MKNFFVFLFERRNGGNSILEEKNEELFISRLGR